MSDTSDSVSDPSSALLEQKNPAKLFQDILQRRPPYCSGSLQVKTEELILFYGKDINARRLDFNVATERELQELADACDPASFGRNHEEVLDETYRKAGKLDSEYFSLLFDPKPLDQIIREELLNGETRRSIHVEKYKLNVYGKDSFFKPHVDTPRAENMFGSLVIILPTPFEGGALVLRDGGKEWTVDAAAEIASKAQPCIAYISFFGDVEHEVMPVTSGYRVTITYNLYYGTGSTLHYGSSTQDDTYDRLKATFEDLLADAKFLSNTRYLGFGLQRRYGFSASTDLDDFANNLKGPDAILMQVCQDLSLDASVKMYYDNPFEDYETYEDYDLLLDIIPDFDGDTAWDTPAQYLLSEYAECTQKVSKDRESKASGNSITIDWMMPRTYNDVVKQGMLMYGNEHSIEYVYGYFCLIVAVEPPGNDDDDDDDDDDEEQKEEKEAAAAVDSA